ncbi:MAG: phosphoribosyltransferase family protein [Bacteroidota bacterium]|jgi:pyrimidine operon attenuation protein/uracil phosphoribosyltransferase
MEPLLILNHQQIQQKINRMAYQIFENNFAESDIVLAGIEQRGFILAQRIEAALKKFSSQNIILLSVEVEKDAPYQKNQAPIIAADLIKDKVVIVVDDVLNSGKTLIYGVNRFLHAPVKKISTLVLVDRNHKSFPVNADYVGLSLATTFKQHIKVVFSESGDAAYLQ